MTRPSITSAVKRWSRWRSQSPSDGLHPIHVMGPILCTAMHNSSPAYRQEFPVGHAALVCHHLCFMRIRGHRGSPIATVVSNPPALITRNALCLACMCFMGCLFRPTDLVNFRCIHISGTDRTQSHSLRRPGKDEDGQSSPG